MSTPGNKQPTHYEVRRASSHPIKINDAGRLALSQIIIVEPAPNVRDEILEAASRRNRVRLSPLNTSGTEGVFEIVSPAQSVESMANIRSTIKDLRAALNAAIDPAEYVKAVYETPHYDTRLPQ